MRKIFTGIMAAVVFLLVTGCSSDLDEKNTGVQENKGGVQQVLLQSRCPLKMQGESLICLR